MSFLASEKTENTALHILIFFLIKTFFKYLERGYQKKKKHHASMFTIVFTGSIIGT